MSGNDISLTVSENSFFTDGGYFLGGEACALPTALLDVMKGESFTVEMVLGAVEAVDPAQNAYITLLSNNGGTNAEKFSLYIQTSKGSADKLVVKSSGISQSLRPQAASGGRELAENSTVAFTFTAGGKAVLWVDGALISEVDAPAANGNNAATATTLALGDSRISNSSNTLFKGLRFYSRALSALEIASNHAVDTGASPIGKALRGDYITRGLVSLYNGVGYDATDTIWSDEYGENDITGLAPNASTGVGFEREGWRVIGTKHRMPDALLDVLAGEEFTFEMRLGDVEALDLSSANYITFIANNGGSNSEKFAVYVQTAKGTMDKLYVKTSGLSSANRPVVTSGGTALAADSTLTVTFKAGGSVKLYVDGALLVTKAAPATNGNTGMTNLYFGENDSTKAHDALYKGFRFYTAELSAAEVSHNRQADLTIVPADPGEGEERGDPLSLGYIENGLVSLYDGTYNSRDGHVNGAKTWMDLWGENDFKVTNNQAGRFTENAYALNATEYSFPTAIMDLINSNAFTLEMTLGDFATIAGTTYATLLNSTANDNFALFWRASTGELELKAGGNTRLYVPDGASVLPNATVTITFERTGMMMLYINGWLESAVSSSATIGGTGTLKFGNAESSKKHIAEFKTFRFYDRALTEEEIVANATVDGTYDPNALREQEFTTVRQRHTGIVGDVTFYSHIRSAAELAALASTETPPANAIFHTDELLNVTSEDGTPFDTVEGVLAALDGVLPVFYVENAETVEALCSYLSSHRLFDCALMSADPALIEAAHDAYALPRSIVDFSETYTSPLTAADLSQIRRTVNAAHAKVVFLSPEAAGADEIRWLNARELTVNLSAGEVNDEEEALRLLLSGTYGLLTPSLPLFYEVCEEFVPEGTITRFPLNVAHRGYFKDVPENTLESVIAAYEEGADAVEIDVYITTDGEIVVNHDASTTLYNSSIGVESHTLAQLKELYIEKNGVRYRMPSLREIFTYFADKEDLMFRIEIKSGKEATVTALKALIEEFGFYDRCTVISFPSTKAGERLQAIYPEMPFSLLYGTSNAWPDTASAVRNAQKLIQSCSATFSPTSSGYTAEFVDAALKRGITCWVWTLSTASTVHPYMLYGHSGITGNDCTLLAKIAGGLRSSLPASVNVGEQTTPGGVLCYGNGNLIYNVCTPVPVSGDVTVSEDKFTVNAPGEAVLLLEKTVRLGSYGSYTLMTQPVTVTAVAQTQKKYDLNSDGTVDISDATVLLDALSAGNPAARCDFNADGNTDIADVTMLLNALANGTANEETL